MASRKEDDGFLKPDQVLATWGEQWKDLASHPKVKFTDAEVYVHLSHKIPTTANDEGDTETSQIVLTEPTVGQMKLIDSAKGDIAKAAMLVQQCGDLTAASVNKIKGRDFILLNKVVGAFLSDGHQTSET